MSDTTLIEDGWSGLTARLAAVLDLEASARAAGAFTRSRAVPDATTLLRLALAYGGCGLSLRQTCAWAEAGDIARLADPSLLERLTGAADWLGAVAGALLAARLPAPTETPARRLRLVDATAICRPGADRTSWRLHAAYDLAAQRLDAVELTDGSGAERLTRFAFAPGELVLADRYYARPGALRPVCDAGADFIVRTGWNSLRLLAPDGASFDLMAALDATGPVPAEHAVGIDERRPVPAPLVVRLVIGRLPAEAAAAACRRLRRDAKKRGRTPDARSLKAAGFVLLLTSLPAETTSAEAVLALYRLRWQVELAFKRLKSLLGLGALPAKSAALARAWLHAKLILALLVEDQAHAFLALSPSGPPALAVAPHQGPADEPRRRRARAAAPPALVR